MTAPAIDAPEAIGDLRIQRLEISNYLKIETLTINANGNHILASGPNESGKSTICDAVSAVLTGKPARSDTPEPIHQGEDVAEVTLDMTAYVVYRKWTAKRMTLKVTRADGSEVRKPQEFLDGMRAQHSLNPLLFLEARPQDQANFVLSVAGVAPPTDQILTITGEKHDSLPGETAFGYLDRLAADKTGTLYLRRLEVGKIADQKKAALEEQRRALVAAGGPLTEADKEASATGLLEQIKKLESKDDQRKALVDRASEARSVADEKKRKLAGLQAKRQGSADAIAELDAHIARLQAERQKAAEELAKQDEYIQLGIDTVAELCTEASACQEAADAFPDPRPELARLRAAVQQAEMANRSLIKRELEGKRLSSLTQESAAAVKEHERWDGMLNRVRELRETILRGVDFGVEGLTVGQGGLRLNGIPFVQASRAQSMKVAFAVVAKQKPHLRIVWVDECERLDAESYETLVHLANLNKFQLLMTEVNRKAKGLEIEIIDAKVS